MSKHYVQILCDLDCEWEGLNPIYRLYVNEELFAERTWIWADAYLEEIIQIEAEPGEYHIRYELVEPHLAQFSVKNMRVSQGPATIDNNTVRILA